MADDRTIVGDTAAGSSGPQKPFPPPQKKDAPEEIPEVHPVRENIPTPSRDQKNSVASDVGSKQDDLSNGARILEEHIITPAPAKTAPAPIPPPAVVAPLSSVPKPAPPIIAQEPVKPIVPVAPPTTPASVPTAPPSPKTPVLPKPEVPKPAPIPPLPPTPQTVVPPSIPPPSTPVSSRIGSLSAALSARMDAVPEPPRPNAAPEASTTATSPPSVSAKPETEPRLTPIIATAPIIPAKKETSEISRIVEETKLPKRIQPIAVQKEVTPEGAPQPRTIATILQDPTKPKESSVPGPFTAPKMPASEGDSLVSSIVAPLRTLKNDLQNIVRVKKISLVRAAALEQDKHRHTSEEERGEHEGVRSHRAFGIIFTATLLIALGAAALFGIYIVASGRTNAPNMTPNASILFAENTFVLPLDERSSLELKRSLANARTTSNAPLGSITRFVPTMSVAPAEGSAQTATAREATLEEFLKALAARAPQGLLRALSPEFFFGVHTLDENAPLLVIPVTSYEHAFAGMLAWEDSLNADLAPVFTAVSDQTIGSGGLPEKRRFDDIVMRNYDVRVLKDDAGQIQLYYSFPTQRLLIIGESSYSFAEILSRLRAERKL